MFSLYTGHKEAAITSTARALTRLYSLWSYVNIPLKSGASIRWDIFKLSCRVHPNSQNHLVLGQQLCYSEASNPSLWRQFASGISCHQPMWHDRIIPSLWQRCHVNRVFSQTYHTALLPISFTMHIIRRVSIKALSELSLFPNLSSSFWKYPCPAKKHTRFSRNGVLERIC